MLGAHDQFRSELKTEEMHMQENIHIIEKTMSFRQIEDDLWVTGDWELGSGERKRIEGGNVLLHLNQKAGCHLGGKIVELRPVNWSEKRVEIVFTLNRDLTGKTHNGNWGQYKIVTPSDDDKKAA